MQNDHKILQNKYDSYKEKVKEKLSVYILIQQYKDRITVLESKVTEYQSEKDKNDKKRKELLEFEKKLKEELENVILLKNELIHEVKKDEKEKPVIEGNLSI